MIPSNRLAFIGNSLPRRCGIATFTSDLRQAVAGWSADVDTGIVAMTDHGHAYDYPPVVRYQIDDQRPADYAGAAEFLNGGYFDAACLQHEFGIFGGEAGGHLLELTSRLRIPLVTTLHTVLAEPSRTQESVLKELIGASATVVVMAEKARRLLQGVYDVPASRIEVIPHGIPDYPFVEPDAAKARLGFDGKPVILTFGLLSPNKGIEVMIDAMPSILSRCPDCVYVVLGATHPNLVRSQGEEYRDSLLRRARDLGVEDHVVFLNRFVDQPTLLDFISMCDVYVTPYLNEAQMTSGTLAYSFGLGKAVVSTPYWHAQELLAEGRGVLVPFGNAAIIGARIAELLTDEAGRRGMRTLAYSSSRSMTWERTAERYLTVLGAAQSAHRAKSAALRRRASPWDASIVPPMRLAHFTSMCDDTGLFQHAVRSIPDRSHGYCIDDNARALLVACALNSAGEQRLPEVITTRLAAFVQHAWNRDAGRFRNFMGFDRRWLEERGSEDSHARTLWALGECSRYDAKASRRAWAVALFKEAMVSVEAFHSPRSWAFTLLGLNAYCNAVSDDAEAAALVSLLAGRLMDLLSAVATDDWVWFEEGLAYDNARLPQALIVAGIATGRRDFRTAGLRSLRWLMTQQTTADGVFRPVGSKSFGDRRKRPWAFDQQPLEATATISACLTARRTDGDARWKRDAEMTFAWFFGKNDLALPLVDVDTGSCCDGLHPDRLNENKGGESVVSYLLALAEMRRLDRKTNTLATVPA